MGITAILALTLFSANTFADRPHHRNGHSYKHYSKPHHYRGDHYHHFRRHYYPRHHYPRHHRSYFSFYVGPSLFYYRDHHYYHRDRHTREYVIVEKPEGADKALREAAAQELYIYPGKGQTAEEQERDRYDCHVWATDQSGVDPGLEDVDSQDILDYRRAISACLEARGYTVK